MSTIVLLLVVFFAALAGVTAYVLKKSIHVWLPGYFATPKPHPVPDQPIDIVFLFVDHFEMAGKADRLNAWIEGYPKLASRHKDSDGKAPQHTWFYAIDLMHRHELEPLAGLVELGLGEVELHWHHSHTDKDTFIGDLRNGLSILQEYGFMLPYKDNQAASFAFIHGNWSLDNSRGGEFCGIDNEIEILLQEGCYADFTYPSLFRSAQPSRPNQILYATDDGRPKSYERGRLAARGQPPAENELQIFQGPLAINWSDWRFKWHPAIEDGDINRSESQGLPARIRCWVDQSIHVRGQPNWWFVKIFCHGAQDHQFVLGAETDRMHEYLEENYNDGDRYRLHYVTAREAYNIVRAAEDGKTGNPNEFRDYLIPHPRDRAIGKG